MTSNSALPATGRDGLGPDLSQNQAYAERQPARRPAPETAPPTSFGHRLEISQDPESGAWIYTVTDRDTGQIIAQHVREAVARMGETPDYAAGALIKAKA
jgi:hypothetical protein